MTLADALHDAERRLRDADIADPRIEAELLLAHALGCTRERLYARLRDVLPSGAAAAFEALLARRLAHEPSAYLMGRREFFGLDFACTPAALIPRPETELLVELGLAWLHSRPATRDPRPWVVDVGTGNGAIAVSIAVHAPHSRVLAIDTSRAALELACENARAHGVAARIDFVQASLLDALRGPVDLIVANLPYVPAAAYRRLAPEIREHEPRAALLAGRRGTAVIEALLASASRRLRPGGLLLAEHAWNQGKRLGEAARAASPNARIETMRDLAGRERVLVVEIP